MKKVKKRSLEEKNIDYLKYLDKAFFVSEYKTKESESLRIIKNFDYKKEHKKILESISKKLYAKFKFLNKIYNFEYIWFVANSKIRKLDINNEIQKFFNKKVSNIKFFNISKIPDSKEQKSLDSIELRKYFSEKSFILTEESLEIKNILLIDDVIDSWETLEAIAKLIKTQNKVSWKIISLTLIWTKSNFENIKDI